MSDVKRIPLSIIRKSPKNPRKILSDIQQEDSKQSQTIEGLAQNIQEIGLINPITVKPSGDEYIIVAGERRFEALKSLNYLDVPCIIIDPNNEQEALIMLSENLQRKDLDAVEKSNAIWEYREVYAAHTGEKVSYREIARKLGLNHAYVTDLMHLNGYPDDVKQMVKDGDISEESVRPLKQLDTDTEKIKTAQYIADNELNHKQAKQVVEVVKNLPVPIKEKVLTEADYTIEDARQEYDGGWEIPGSSPNYALHYPEIEKFAQRFSVYFTSDAVNRFANIDRIYTKKLLWAMRDRIDELLEVLEKK